MEELLGLEVEFVQEDVPVGSPYARGKLIKVDRFGVLLEKHSWEEISDSLAVIHARSLHSGKMIVCDR